MKKLTVITIGLSISIWLTGCSIPLRQHELLNPEIQRGKVCLDKIKIYEKENASVLPSIYIALLSASGNRLIPDETLQLSLKKEGADIGADYVIITGREAKKKKIWFYSKNAYLGKEIIFHYIYGKAYIFKGNKTQ